MWEKLPIEIKQKIYMFSIESPFIIYKELYSELINEIKRRQTYHYRISQAKLYYDFYCKRILYEKVFKNKLKKI